MLPINYSRYKYTPDEMTKEEFLERFVVRHEIFEEIFDDIKTADYKVANQHYIIIGQRGQGKTTLLRKLQIEVENDKKLSKFLLPVKFAEEQYQIRSLSRLWEEVADYLQSLYVDEFPHVLDEMEEHFEDDDYEIKAFSYLETVIKKKKKKLLLLIDNIDELIGKLSEKEQRRLREILLESSSFRIVGGSTKMLEQHYNYGKPFYEFFKIIKLKGFTKEESIDFLRSIGKGEQKEKMEAIIQNNPARIETLRQLTGGVPRTLVMLFDIFLDEEGNAFDDLLKVLDEATPLYKHRIDELPPQLQEIVHTIAINWDGMYTSEIAKKTRLSTKVISAQLGKLEKYDIIESEQAGKNKIYKIKERFFNIWYLMRFGRKKDRERVEWLVKFLQSWCTQEDLDERANNLIGKVKEGNARESYVYHMTEALSYAGINYNLEKRLKNEVKNYFKDIQSNYLNDISKSQLEIMNDISKAVEYGQPQKALMMINKLNIEQQFIEKYKKVIRKAINIQESNKRASLALEEINDTFAHTLGMYDIEKVLSDIPYDNKMSYLSLEVLVYFWFDKLQKSEDAFIQLLNEISEKKVELYSEIIMFFNLLMFKEQYYQAKKILEIPEYNLKEKYKPTWYALMTLMQDEFPHEIKKMGSELQESVDEVLKKVEEYKEKYPV